MGLDIREVKDWPSVSVVVPVYNMAPFVERCILSVMHQSFPANECIIVDDASTDDGIARCKQLINKYNGPTHFFILSHDHNRGLSAARNTGTDAATSEYVYYLDSDDEITSDCLEKLVSPVLDTIEMVLGEYNTDYTAMLKWKWRGTQMRSHFTPIGLDKLDSNEEICSWYYSLKGSKPDQVWNKLLRLSFIRKNKLYNEEGLLYEDLLWTNKMLRCIEHVAFIHDVTYIHHRRPGSIMTDRKKDEYIQHHGYIFKEIAMQVEYGKRIEEALRWVPDYCRCYIDATTNEDYQNVYKTFCHQLSSGRQWRAFCYLKMVHLMGKNEVGRIIYKKSLWVWDQGRRIIRFISN